MKRFFVLFIVVIGLINVAKADITHIVDRGETLDFIAKKYDITIQDIINLNPEAAQFVYTGMELTIPETGSAVQTPPTIGKPIEIETVEPVEIKTVESVEIETVEPARDVTETIDDEDPFESDRKKGVIEIHYAANSFEHAKLSGSYGMSITGLYWRMARKLYGGVYFSPFNFNFGLVPKELAGDVIKLGPAIGYYFTPKLFISVPLAVDLGVFNIGTKTSTSWALEVSPAAYIGDKAGIVVGPSLYIPFQEGAKVSFGFKIGLYF